MKKLFSILLKIVGGILLLGLVIFGITYLIYNEPLPEGSKGSEADALAYKMLEAINHDAYKNTQYLEWSLLDGKHKYKWDKANGKVIVNWGDYTVKLNLNDTSKSIASKKNELISAKESKDIVNTAWDYFNNDSFWLVAPFKVFDQGTIRSVVSLDDGTKGLLVTYASGGTTPGDSYLWKLKPNGFPKSYQMWTSIVPIGGIEATWDDWKIMESGVFLPTSHQLGPVTINMGPVKAYN